MTYHKLSSVLWELAAENSWLLAPTLKSPRRPLSWLSNTVRQYHVNSEQMLTH